MEKNLDHPNARAIFNEVEQQGKRHPRPPKKKCNPQSTARSNHRVKPSFRRGTVRFNELTGNNKNEKSIIQIFIQPISLDD